MRVYKFLTSEFALKDIREQRIKISEFHDLNDPFEFLPVDLSDPENRAALLRTRDELGKTRGLLSFACNFSNPVLWAHYSDKHRGICLGFDADNSECEEMHCKEIHYVHERIPLIKPDLGFMEKILFTKFAGWEYEQEIRCFATRETEENGLYFFPFGDKLKLREVIIGHRCCTERSEISAALARYSEPVEISAAYLSNEGLKVLKNAGDF